MRENDTAWVRLICPYMAIVASPRNRSFSAIGRGKQGRMTALERRAAKAKADEERKAQNAANKEKLSSATAASDMKLTPEQEAARAKVLHRAVPQDILQVAA